MTKGREHLRLPGTTRRAPWRRYQPLHWAKEKLRESPGEEGFVVGALGNGSNIEPEGSLGMVCVAGRGVGG